MYNFTNYCFLLVGFLLLTTVSEVKAQTQTAEVSDKNIKFLAYKPQNYDSKSEHPLLIFMHGLGEKGDNLDLVKRNGPPKLINQGQWPSDRPFIVISPQLPGNYGNWPPTLVDDLVEYVKKKYKVDNSRIYVTGLSLGGNGAWMYATNYPEKVAATVPVCGWGTPGRSCEMKDVPSWAFHGNNDGTVAYSGSVNMVNGINNCNPGPKVPAKLTTYPGVGHDAWTRTYDMSAGHDIYSWMLNYTKGGPTSKPNTPPTVSAGNDKSLTLPANSISISGTASDSDGSIDSYSWTKTSGPNASLQDTDKAELKISAMVEGTYIFKLTVKDNDEASGSDEVKITVNPAANSAPTVSAGDDKSLTLPANSISISGTASDNDGSIASYSWTKASGPNANLQDTDKEQLKVSEMVEGTYIFKLTVKDNDEASASDEVKITVNPAANNAPTLSAGDDKTLTLPANSIAISGTASDSDGSIASYNWTKSSGPDANLQDTDKPQLKASEMVQGDYIFKLTVKDNDGASASDEVKVSVNPAANNAPTLSAGDDKSLTLPTNSISISGTASDSDGSIDSYSWTKTSGPNANLQDADKEQLKVSEMVEGAYIFKITVKDNDGASASDEVKITVNPASNNAPTVSAGDDKTLTLPANSITISGSASDNDGSVASYSWTKTSGPNANLQNTDKEQLKVSEMVQGDYIFKLTVKDNDGASASDEVKVTVNQATNNGPTVNAGDDKTLTLPENSIAISGTASDNDGSIATYNWTKSSGPDANLQDTDKAELKVSAMLQGEYIFKLTVKDNDGASASDEVKVTVNAASNNAPIVNAGNDKTLTLPGNSIVISGTASDNDGSIATYNWTKSSGPDANLQDTDKAELKVSAMLQGEYIFKLTVKDNDGASASDEVKVTVNAASNNAPTVNVGNDKTLTLPENSIAISGTASDNDGSIASYNWTKSSGPEASLQDTDKAELKISVMVEGEYIFKLTVKDNDGASASDEVKVTVNQASNNAPTVNLGDDLLLNLPKNNVTLSANAADSDGSIVSYNWTQTSGPSAHLSGNETEKLSVSNMFAGSYTFKLIVVDNNSASASDEIKIRVNNPPLANAGYDKSVVLPKNAIFLSGAGSDSDGTITSYQWSKISGGSVIIKDEKTHLLSLSDLQQGQYEFELIVKDNNGASASDRVKVIVNPAENTAPTANAGEDVTLELPENSVILQGSGYDADGKIVSFKWNQVLGTKLIIEETNASDLFLMNLTTGIYEFELLITDDQGAVASDKVTVTVIEVTEVIEPLSILISKNDLTCFGDNNGNAEAAVSGGTPPYSYSWSNGASTAKVLAMEAGTYTLTVTDAAGVEGEATFDIKSPEKIEILASISPTDGAKGLGAIKIDISGGTAPYTTKWSMNNVEAPQLIGNNLSGLDANIYTLQVTDAKGCTASETFTVSKKGKNSIAVYPNPTEGTFNIAIDASGGAYELSIINSKGKIIHTEGGKQDDNGNIAIREFDLTGEGRGIYFVKVQYQFGTFSINRVIVK